MNKQELVDAVAAKTGGSKAAAAATVDALIGTITATVTKGDTVQLVGFGSFSTGARGTGWAQSGNRRRNPDPGRENGEVHGRQSIQGRSEQRLTSGGQIPGTPPVVPTLGTSLLPRSRPKATRERARRAASVASASEQHAAWTQP